MKLRSYQQSGINDLRSQFAQGVKRTVYVAPCGAGKSKMMSFMAAAAAERGNSTMFLLHRSELIDQMAATLREDGIDYGIIAPRIPMRDRLIQIASVQTLNRRVSKITAPTLVIPDECHHAVAVTWRSILDYFADAYAVGLTATPQRLGGQGLGDVFGSLVIGPTARELIQQGYLAPYRYYAPPMVADLTGIKTKLGDFENGEIAIRMDRPAVIGDAVSHYLRLAPGKRAIAYCSSRQHSIHTAEAFSAAGISAKHIDGETPPGERKQAIEDFRSGELTVLTNVDLISEGFDVPAMEAVILLRPTQSLTLYIQQSMRPMRPDKSNPFKEAVIIDHVGNVHRHGLPDEDREWSLEGIKKRSRGEGGAVSVRKCPGCFSVHRPQPICPYCGHVYNFTPRQIAEEAGTLQEYDAAQSKKKRIEQGMARTYEDLLRIERDRGYKPGWARIQWNFRQKKKLKGPK